MGKTGKIDCPVGLTEEGLINFRYLQAVYSLNVFYGYGIMPRGYFTARDEKICADTIRKGGTVADMYKSGADPLYCALLSDPATDREILLKQTESYIPF
jgi:hypothetical protein